VSSAVSCSADAAASNGSYREPVKDVAGLHRSCVERDQVFATRSTGCVVGCADPAAGSSVIATPSPAPSGAVSDITKTSPRSLVPAGTRLGPDPPGGAPTLPRLFRPAAPGDARSGMATPEWVSRRSRERRDLRRMARVRPHDRRRRRQVRDGIHRLTRPPPSREFQPLSAVVRGA